MADEVEQTPEAVEPKPEPPLNVYQRKRLVMADADHVVKRGQTEFGERFKYAKHDDVMEAVRGPMVDHGLDFDFKPRWKKAKRDEHGKTKSGTMQYRWELPVTFCLVNVDEPADRTDPVTIVGEGIDTGDKGVGKALSYATKNYLLKTFLLPAGDDADNESADTSTSDPARGRQRQSAPPAQRQAAPAQAPAGPPAPLVLFWKEVRAQGVEDELVGRWLTRNLGSASSKDLTPEKLATAQAWVVGRKEALEKVALAASDAGYAEGAAAERATEMFSVASPDLLTLEELASLAEDLKTGSDVPF